MSRPRSLASIAASGLTIVGGVLLLCVGSIFINQTNYISGYWTQIYGLSIYSIIIGGLAVIFASILIYVVIKQFPALTTLFSGCLVFVAFAAVVCAALLIAGRPYVGEISYNNTAKIFRNYSESDLVVSSKNIVSKIQQSLKCCGVQKATYWIDKYPDKTSTPDSCCIKIITNCGNSSLKTQDQIYLRGCAEPLSIHINNKYTTLIALNFVVVVFTLASAILGIIFERYIRQQYQLM